MFSLVAAMSLNKVIWKNNALPWYLPEDLKNFKQLTRGKKIVMWYNTFCSIWKPLPERENIILTTKNIEIDWCKVFWSIKQLQDYVEPTEEVMVIGWSSIYKQFIENNLANKIYLSIVPEEYEWDTFFPDFEESFFIEKSIDYETFTLKIYSKN